jgi:hypothetical protein
MIYKINHRIVKTLWVALGLVLATGCGKVAIKNISVRPTLEDLKPNGDLYSSSTQSLLRQAHWLDTVSQIDISMDSDYIAEIELKGSDKNYSLSLHNLHMDHLVPRLHYQPATPLDEFDAYNLMMAEFSRTGISVPQGKKGDEMAHFRSNLKETVPWTLTNDYEFNPNLAFKPMRVSLINNCLASGLWEINATDRAGEIYHAWFDMPQQFYYELTAKVNDLPVHFVKKALPWDNKKVKMDLNRLRNTINEFGEFPITVLDSQMSYSSQDSRRKLAKGFVKIKRDGDLVKPESLNDFRSSSIFMSDFIEPGKYSFTDRKEIDLRFLFNAKSATFYQVEPKTSYSWNNPIKTTFKSTKYLELMIQMDDDIQLIIGNLPLSLLVRQEDFQIYGLGVGVLAPAEVAERRDLLLAEGHHPSFAYLAEKKDGQLYAVNSHDIGIEQIFIRCNPFDNNPHFEITIASYERITDVIKYRVAIPNEILPQAMQYSKNYVSPIFFTYRDDNLR